MKALIIATASIFIITPRVANSAPALNGEFTFSSYAMYRFPQAPYDGPLGSAQTLDLWAGFPAPITPQTFNGQPNDFAAGPARIYNGDPGVHFPGRTFALTSLDGPAPLAITPIPDFIWYFGGNAGDSSMFHFTLTTLGARRIADDSLVLTGAGTYTYYSFSGVLLNEGLGTVSLNIGNPQPISFPPGGGDASAMIIFQTVSVPEPTARMLVVLWLGARLLVRRCQRAIAL